MVEFLKELLDKHIRGTISSEEERVLSPYLNGQVLYLEDIVRRKRYRRRVERLLEKIKGAGRSPLPHS